MTAVLLFAKAPRPGAVKTRLARVVGVDRAARIYRAMGRQVVRQVRAHFPLTVWYTPPDAEPEMRDWLGDLVFRAQPEGDLGHRLAAAFAAHFTEGDGPVIAIGADAPGVDAATVQAAVQALESCDVVLGPAQDGGYYLIGLCQPRPELFRDVPWSTKRVLETTRRRAEAAGLETALLAPLADVDTVEDLDRAGFMRS